MIGYYADVPFEVSSDKVQTIKDFVRTTTSRWNEQAVNLNKPVKSFAGPGLDNLSFSITLSMGLGVKPEEVMNKFINYCRNGEAHIFSIGGRPLGIDRWVVDDVGQAYNYILNNGVLYSCELTLSLSEYVEEII